MPHSLRARLSWLRYKKIISDKDYGRLCKALDNENILDKIRAEIELAKKQGFQRNRKTYDECISIINKHIGEGSEEEE